MYYRICSEAIVQRPFPLATLCAGARLAYIEHKDVCKKGSLFYRGYWTRCQNILLNFKTVFPFINIQFVLFLAFPCPPHHARRGISGQFVAIGPLAGGKSKNISVKFVVTVYHPHRLTKIKLRLKEVKKLT